MQLYPIRLGITIGILWGVSMLLLALFTGREYGSVIFKLISKVYIGCSQKNILSKLVCGLYGFIDGFITGALIALLYNFIAIDK